MIGALSAIGAVANVIGSLKQSGSTGDGIKSDFLSKFDGNGDGSVSKSELAAGLKSAGVDASRVDKLMSKLDSDGDGAISSTEAESTLSKFAGRLREQKTAGADSPDASAAAAQILASLGGTAGTLANAATAAMGAGDATQPAAEDDSIAALKQALADDPGPGGAKGGAGSGSNGGLEGAHHGSGHHGHGGTGAAGGAGQGDAAASGAATSSSAVISALDTNGDGTVSQSELLAAFQGGTTTPAVTSTAATASTTTAAINTTAATSASASAANAASTTTASASASTLASRVQSLFTSLDRDGDGAISSSDLTAAIKSADSTRQRQHAAFELSRLSTYQNLAGNAAGTASQFWRA